MKLSWFGCLDALTEYMDAKILSNLTMMEEHYVER